MKPWFVYIVKCSDDSLYTGITVDIDARLEAHNNGTGSKYTCLRRPVVLLYKEQCVNRSEATKREYEIKKLPRRDKLKLIGNF